MSVSEGWNLEYDNAAPPLPKELDAELARQYLEPGAYFAWVEPEVAGHGAAEPPQVLPGILRVHYHEPQQTISASGDLYSSSRTELEVLKNRLAGLRGDAYEKDRLQALQLPQDRYRYYLRAESLSPSADGLRIRFETYYWRGIEDGWEEQEAIVLHLDTPVTAHRETSYEVRNDSTTQVARIRLARIANALRHAEIRVFDPVKPKTFPALWDTLSSRTALARAGWSIGFDELQLEGKATAKAAKARRPWSRAQLNRFHDKFIEEELREDQQESRLWRYHFLVVEDIVFGDTGNPSGLLYDAGGKSPDDLARQGAAVAAGATKRTWLPDRKGRLADYPNLFQRVALHELGHMQGLYHNERGSEQALMQPHGQITGKPDDEIELEHDRFDEQRLRHLPDHWVRPGGVPFGYRYRETALDVLNLFPESPGLKLEVRIEPSDEIVLKRGPGGKRRGRPKALVLVLTNDRSLEEAVTSLFVTPPLQVKTYRRADVLCPNELQVQPRYRRLGMFLTEPSGRRRELWPARVPRLLGLGSTTLFGRPSNGQYAEASGERADGERIRYRIPWTRDNGLRPLRQPGEYELEVHLMWAAEYQDSEKQPYRVSETVEFSAFRENGDKNEPNQGKGGRDE